MDQIAVDAFLEAALGHDVTAFAAQVSQPTLVLHRRELFALRRHLCGDLLLLTPLCGVILAAFVAIGEARYRVPFDGFIILLAARFYCGVRPEENRLMDRHD